MLSVRLSVFLYIVHREFEDREEICYCVQLNSWVDPEYYEMCRLLDNWNFMRKDKTSSSQKYFLVAQCRMIWLVLTLFFCRHHYLVLHWFYASNVSTTVFPTNEPPTAVFDRARARYWYMPLVEGQELSFLAIQVFYIVMFHKDYQRNVCVQCRKYGKCTIVGCNFKVYSNKLFKQTDSTNMQDYPECDFVHSKNNSINYTNCI